MNESASAHTGQVNILVKTQSIHELNAIVDLAFLLVFLHTVFSHFGL